MADTACPSQSFSTLAHRYRAVGGSGMVVSILASLAPQAARANPPWLQPDASLGAEGSQVVERGDKRFEIEGGAARSQNLFHSFERFGVPENHRVFLQASNPAIENILLRVTGGDRSNIFGTLGIEGSTDPNLFLLNPHGIIFGPNAQLELGGSFIASTASQLEFADGSLFLATPGPSSLLSISQPVGLGLGANSGTVLNQGELRVGARQSLVLAGGGLEQRGKTTASGGEVALLGMPGGGEVALNEAGQVVGLQYNGVPGGAATVAIAGRVDVASSEVGGTVKVLGDRIALESGSAVEASGSSAGGRILIGGSVTAGAFAGSDAVYIAPGAALQANGSELAGDIIIWSENSSRIQGRLTALGPAGGFVETSSAEALDTAGMELDLAPGGTWLLDPRDIVIGSGSQRDITITPGDPQRFSPTSEQSRVNIGDLEQQLNAGANIIISTSTSELQDSGGEQKGNIVAERFGLNKTSDLPASLTLQADNNIDMRRFGFRAAEGAAPLSLILQADADQNGRGGITIESGGIETRGGDFIATAGDSIVIQGAEAVSNVADPLPGGETRLTAPRIEFQSGGKIQRNATGQGIAGNIRIDAQTLNLNGSINTTAQGNGTTGNGTTASIEITAEQLNIQRGGINSKAEGNLDALPLLVIADVIELNNGGINGSTSGQGRSAEMTIQGGKLRLEKSSISNKTFDAGDSGGLTIEVPVVEILQNSAITSRTEPGSSGRSGDLRVIATEQLSLDDKVGLSNGTQGQGNAGALLIRTGELTIRKNSGITSNSQVRGKSASDLPQSTLDQLGDAGRLEITASQILLDQQAGILAQTQGAGQGGNISIVSDRLTVLDRSNIANNALIGSRGDAGSITIQAREAVRFEGRFPTGIGSESRGTGRGGSVSISAPDVAIREGAGISLTNQPTGERGGDLRIQAERLLIEDGGVFSETQGPGKGGSIAIAASEQVTLKDSGISTSAKPDEREAENPQAIANLGEAGDIEIATPKLFLSEGSRVSSESFSQSGGNITLDVPQQLFLQENSRISATAGSNQTGGDGGNVRINSGLIIAIPDENSDISANAFSGSGGNVSITTDGLVGLTVRDRPSPKSDITASSQTGIQGNIVLEQPDVDPSRGLAELPENLADPSDRIAQGCRANGASSRFVASGRGGIPQGPDAPLQGRVAEAEWIEVEGGEVAGANETDEPGPALASSQAVIALAEARSWQRDDEGLVELVVEEQGGELAIASTNCQAKPIQ